MKIKILTLFPEMLRPMLSESILGRAIEKGYISVELIDIRAYTLDKHRNTDDYPFGGGAGMVMYAQPIVDAVQAVDPEHRAKRLYMSPRGKTLTQKTVEALSKEEEIVLLCGHYEGVDERALQMCMDGELSIGDYVLTGGELAALVVTDSVARLVPGVLGSDESSEDESFTTGLLEYPQYTRPAEFRGERVPEVLLNGNHADIVAWRREKSLELTLKKRPEMLETAPLTDRDKATVNRLKTAEALRERFGDAVIERPDYLETDKIPKKWIAAFVPEENRKTAKKVCISGRRHVGFLWQAFENGLIENGEKFEMLGECVVYLEKSKNAFRLKACPENLPDDAVVFDAEMTRTLIPQRGYYCRIK